MRQADGTGKAFVKSLTHASPTKRAALSTLLKGAWFEPVRKELDDMYDIVVNHGRLARGLGRSRPGLGAISHAASQNDASHVGTAMQANVTPDKHSTTPRVLVRPSDPSPRYKGKSKSKRKAGARAEEAEEEEAVDEAGETVQSLIKVKPSKRRKVIESVAETALAEPQDAEEPEENEQQRTDEDADKSGSSPDSAPAPVKGKGKGDKGKAAAQGSGRGKDKAASTPTATKHSAAGKKGKGKAPAQPPLESVPETPHSQVQQNELDFFPSASQQRTSLFLPSSGIFGPQVTPTQPQHHQPTQKQRSLPDPSPATLATVARALTTMGKGVSETPEQGGFMPVAIAMAMASLVTLFRVKDAY